MAMKRSLSKATKGRNSWDRKEPVTIDYIRWFVAHQSGDARLARTLAAQWRKGGTWR
jgi:hypothetical protein